MKDLLQDKTKINYKNEYFKLFGENLLVSHNFIHTYSELTPIFYKKQKHAGQVLIVQENNQIKTVLISTAEAAFFKDYIKRKSPNNIWLLLPSGDPFIGKGPTMTPELQDLLWQVKLFNGNVEELLKDPLTVQKRKWLHEKLLHNFLALKVEYNPRQKGIFYKHFIEKKTDKKDPLSFFRSTMSSTLHAESSNFDKYHPLIAMGISKKEIDGKSVDVKEALFVYANSLKKLKKAGVDLSPILKLDCGDLVKILDNADQVIGLIKAGLSLNILLKTLKPQKRET